MSGDGGPCAAGGCRVLESAGWVPAELRTPVRQERSPNASKGREAECGSEHRRPAVAPRWAWRRGGAGRTGAPSARLGPAGADRTCGPGSASRHLGAGSAEL